MVALWVMVAVTAASCASGDTGVAAFCERVAGGDLVALDVSDAPDRWRALEEVAPGDIRPDVSRIRVAAEAIARGTGDATPADLATVASVALAPRVVAAHRRVLVAVRERCHVDPATGRVLDGT